MSSLANILSLDLYLLMISNANPHLYPEITQPAELRPKPVDYDERVRFGTIKCRQNKILLPSLPASTFVVKSSGALEVVLYVVLVVCHVVSALRSNNANQYIIPKSARLFARSKFPPLNRSSKSKHINTTKQKSGKH